MSNKQPRFLYFIKGAIPSDIESLEAEQLGSNVAYRNANFISDTEALEPCDGVAGAIPSIYKKQPRAAAVFDEYMKARESRIADAAAVLEQARAAKKAEADAIKAAKKKEAEDAKAAAAEATKQTGENKPDPFAGKSA